MKIELKHLAPYLPYDINVLLIEIGKITKILGLSKILFRNRMQIETIFGSYGDMHFKPIVRPLSDLTKEIEHNGERFVPIDVLWNETLEQVDSNTYDDHFFNSDLETTWICQENVLQLEQIVVDKLIEWHFDVFGLIPAGLATELS